MKKLITVLLFSLIISNAYSNHSGAYLYLKKSIVEITDTTYECTIVTGSKCIYKAAELYVLSDSSVIILRGDVKTEILIKDIRSIKFKGRGFWKGAVIGGGIGFGIGFIAGANATDALYAGTQDHSVAGLGILFGVIFAVPSGLIGGGIQSLLAKDKYYDLSNLDFEAKRKKIKQLINEYSDH